MSTITTERLNSAVVRRAYEAFNSADMETLTDTFDESASWHTPGRSPIAGDRQGRAATFAQFGRYVGETGGTFKATLQHVLESDDGRVIGIHHNSAELRGFEPLHPLHGKAPLRRGFLVPGWQAREQCPRRLTHR